MPKEELMEYVDRVTINLCQGEIVRYGGKSTKASIKLQLVCSVGVMVMNVDISIKLSSRAGQVKHPTQYQQHVFRK